MTEGQFGTETVEAVTEQKDEGDIIRGNNTEPMEEQSEAEEEQPEASTSFVPSLSKEEEAQLLKVPFSIEYTFST